MLPRSLTPAPASQSEHANGQMRVRSIPPRHAQRIIARRLDMPSLLLCAVVASEKGVVVGRLTFQEDGDVIDCARMGVGGKAIPPNVDKARRSASVWKSSPAALLAILFSHAWLRYPHRAAQTGRALHVAQCAPLAIGSLGSHSCAPDSVQPPQPHATDWRAHPYAGVQHPERRDVHPAGGEGCRLHAVGFTCVFSMLAVVEVLQKASVEWLCQFNVSPWNSMQAGGGPLLQRVPLHHHHRQGAAGRRLPVRCPPPANPSWRNVGSERAFVLHVATRLAACEVASVSRLQQLGVCAIVAAAAACRRR